MLRISQRAGEAGVGEHQPARAAWPLFTRRRTGPTHAKARVGALSLAARHLPTAADARSAQGVSKLRRQAMLDRRLAISLRAARRVTALMALLAAGFAPVAAQLAGAPAGSGTGVGSTAATLLQNVRFDQHLNEPIPLDAVFRDDTGREITLRNYFSNRPVVLGLVYYRCTMLCNEALTGMASSLSGLKLDPGRDFNVVVVSIDPHDTPAAAAESRRTVLKRYHRAGTEGGWHFLTGDEPGIRALADALGFHYVWDGETLQYAHPTGIVVLTPEARIAQYYFGIEFSPRDVRLGLVEASHHRIGNLMDAITLYCYHYDPVIGRYGAAVMRLVRLAGIATVLALVGFIVFSLRREKKLRRKLILDVSRHPSEVSGR